MGDITIVDIVVTMSIERRSSSPKLVAFAAFGFGLLLFALGAQRVGAYYYIAHVPSEVDRALASGRPLSETVLSNARRNYLAALKILPNSAELQRNYGRLELRRAALFTDDTELHQKAMNSAATYLRAAIAAAPSQAFSWSLEAYVLSALSGSAGDLNRSLRMSYFLGPHEGSSILLRALAGTESWQNLDDDIQGFVREDLKEMWRHRVLRQSLVDIYLDAPLATRSQLRDIIIDSDEDRKKLDRMLIKTVKSTGAG